MGRILLVEDDPSLLQTMTERLQKEGHRVQPVKSCAEAMAQISEKFDLAVLDVGLPDGDGFSLAAKLKKHLSAPFIFVTAMNSAEHRLQGYELGADEYIPKPFHLKEFLLRVKKVLERTMTQIVKVGALEIDLRAMSIKYADGRIEHPTSRDFRVLKYLIEAAPRVVSREELVKDLVSDQGDSLPTFRTVDNSIVRLRDLLTEVAPDPIRAVRGIGYQWVPA
jgi:DNA-binding response OmpR family regulator